MLGLFPRIYWLWLSQWRMEWGREKDTSRGSSCRTVCPLSSLNTCHCLSPNWGFSFMFSACFDRPTVQDPNLKFKKLILDIWEPEISECLAFLMIKIRAASTDYYYWPIICQLLVHIISENCQKMPITVTQRSSNSLFSLINSPISQIYPVYYYLLSLQSRKSSIYQHSRS